MSSATRPITAEIATLLLSLPTDDEHELLGTLGRAIPNVYVALGRPVEPPGSLRQEEVKASRRGIIIEMLADAVKAGRDASLGPAKLSNFLEVHRLLLARTADAADAGRPLTKDDANRLFDELMSAHTVSSPAEHAASIVVASAREGVAAGSAPAATATALAIADGAPAQHTGVVAAESQFSLIELGALARHAKTTGVVALFDLYAFALAREQRRDAVVLHAAVEAPMPAPPLGDASPA